MRTNRKTAARKPALPAADASPWTFPLTDAPSPRRRTGWPAWAWVGIGSGGLLALLVVVVVLLFVAAGGGRSLPHATAPAGETAAQEQFRAFVRQHAQDPAGLEIVEWGESQSEPQKNGWIGKAPEKRRSVKFRCALISHTPSARNFQRGLPVHPVQLDTAEVAYDAHGQIQWMSLARCFEIWHAR